jgi:sugar fermentation stimulation protein A
VKGAYVLVINLTEKRNLRIGSLGSVSFPAGFYAYTGSSMTNLEKRVQRHLRKRKKIRWHIDFLLREAEVVQAILFPSDDKEECDINRQVFDINVGTVIAKGFGSSDCSCETHLAYFGENQPHLEYPHERQTIHPPS